MTSKEIASEIRDTYASHLVLVNSVKSVHSGFYVLKDKIDQSLSNHNKKKGYNANGSFPKLRDAFDRLNEIQNKTNKIFERIVKFYFEEITIDNIVYYKAISNEPDLKIYDYIEEFKKSNEILSENVKKLYAQVLEADD